jgi:hypothetical protein
MPRKKTAGRGHGLPCHARLPAWTAGLESKQARTKDGRACVKAAGCRAKKTAGNGQDGVAGVKWRGQAANNPRVTREIPGARFPATRNATRFRPIAWNCLPGRFVLVAGMAIPEQMRAAVLERVIADVGEHPIQQPEG